MNDRAWKPVRLPVQDRSGHWYVICSDRKLTDAEVRTALLMIGTAHGASLRAARRSRRRHTQALMWNHPLL